MHWSWKGDQMLTYYRELILTYIRNSWSFINQTCPLLIVSLITSLPNSDSSVWCIVCILSLYKTNMLTRNYQLAWMFYHREQQASIYQKMEHKSKLKVRPPCFVINILGPFVRSSVPTYFGGTWPVGCVCRAWPNKAIINNSSPLKQTHRWQWPTYFAWARFFF